MKKKAGTSTVCRLAGMELGGNNPFFLIAGPCVIESEKHCLKLAKQLKEITSEKKITLIFKASFDKANRTSVHSFRGPGLKRGLKILARVKKDLGLAVLSDVHSVDQVVAAAEVLDVLQIPAFLCRQTDLILAAAKTGRILNVKKGQFLAPWDAAHIVDKARSVNSERLMITERGVSFGYNNLVVDFKSLPLLRRLNALVVFDATHSVQLPGGAGAATGGQSEFVPFLARAAAAVGIDGLFLEVHENPKKALSDGPNALKIDLLPNLLDQVQRIDKLVKDGVAHVLPEP